MGDTGSLLRVAARRVLVAALCSSALVPLAHAAQFDVTEANINGGVGQVGSAAWALAQAHSLGGNNVVDFDSSTNLVLVVPQSVLSDTTFQIDEHLRIDAALSGTGNITKTGTGYLVFLSNNTNSGDIDVQQGGLVVIGGATIADTAAVTMSSGTEFEVIGSETIGSLSGSGALFGSKDSANTLTLGGNGTSTAFHVESPDTNLLGKAPCYVLSFVKTGDGTFTLTGVLEHSGSLSVAGGKLVMNGVVESLSTTVNVGAILGGIGHLQDVTVNGTLAPGNSIGTIHLKNTTFNGGSVLQIEIATGGNTPGVHNDLVEVDGEVTINGGTVQLIGGSGTFAPSTTYTILTSTGGVTGTFDAITDNLAFYAATLSYDADNVYADLTATGFGGGTGLSANQQSTGSALDTISGGAPYQSALVDVTNDEAGNVLDQLSGEGFASYQAAMIDQGSYFQGTAFDRIAQSFAALGANSPLGYAPSGALAEPAAMKSLWGAAYGGVIQRAATDETQATDSTSGGLVLGVDGEIAPDWRLGLMASAGLERFTAGNLTANTNNAAAGVYLGGRAGPVDIKLGATYNRHFVESSRAVTFGGLSDALTAQYEAGTAQVFGEVSRQFDLGATTITPFGRVAVLRNDTDGFTETGGAGALITEPASATAAHTTLGVAADYAFVLGDTMLGKIGLSAGWEHVFGGATSVTNSFVLGGDSFVVSGAPVARDTLRLGGAFSLDISSNLALSAKYDGRVGGGLTAHAVTAQVAGQF